MAVINELIRVESDGKLSFGNYELDAKKKVEDFPFGNDLLKVKTFKEITKLERNGMFVYESVPGTTAMNFVQTEKGVSFDVDGNQDAQITLGLADDTVYEVFINGESTGAVQTNLGGKLSVSVELCGNPVEVKVEKV